MGAISFPPGEEEAARKVVGGDCGGVAEVSGAAREQIDFNFVDTSNLLPMRQ